MTFPLSGNLQFYSEKHTIAAGATVRIRLQFQPDTIKFVSMVSITGRVDIKLGGMKGQGLIPLFLQGPVDLPGLEPEQRIELTNQDTVPHTILVVAQKGYQPAGINAPAVSADVAHELLSSQHADTVVATPPIEGDLVVGIEQGDGSILWQRVARGSASDVLSVQANGSLAWGAPVAPAGLPAGVILPYGDDVAPSGYLLCDGATVNRTTFADLFTAITTRYGNGDGSTTFEVPDLRGRFLRGQDAGAGRDPDAAGRTAIQPGGSVGDSVGSLQADQYRSHTHGIQRSSAAGGSPYANWGYTNTRTDQTLGSGGNETRPINVNVYYIIKT